MSILRVLHSNRLAVILGSGLLSLLGFVSGCDSGESTSATAKADVKARDEAEAKARHEAYGKTGVATKANSAKPKS